MCATCVAASLAARVHGAGPGQLAIEDLFARFWTAATDQERAAAADAIVQANVPFVQAYARLKRGRTYQPQPTGFVEMRNEGPRVARPFALVVPDDYRPLRKYPVRIQLHGALAGRTADTPLADLRQTALPPARQQIDILPLAWQDAPWWSAEQAASLGAILETTKRLYNVDENRVVVSGISDGAAGAYYLAMRDPTPYASFLPLNGSPLVLANEGIGVDAPIFLNNLRNRPFFIVNGGLDPLYPAAEMDDLVGHLLKGGVPIEFRPQANGGRDTRWWPEVAAYFDAFVRLHPRRALADRLTWETASTDAGNRIQWLIVDTLGHVAGEHGGWRDLNVFTPPPTYDFGAHGFGMRVAEVVPGSNAEALGLHPADTIVRVNDETVNIFADISERLGSVRPGTRITLLVARDNLPVELSGTYNPKAIPTPPQTLFAAPDTRGRIDALRHENTVEVSTSGVRSFTLLLSPDRFDFRLPVIVVVNGKERFHGRVKPDIRALLKWAAKDDDRTMLFGAELTIQLPSGA